jgi:hypothetical protein
MRPVKRRHARADKLVMSKPLKRNPFPWWPFWPEVEDHSLKTVAAIIVLIAFVAACYWLS